MTKKTKRTDLTPRTATAPLLEEPVTETPAALVPAPAVTMFERLALDPNVPVEKLEKLIELQERIMRHNAEAAFNAAFSKMQPQIPIIDEHGRIEVRGQLRSTYAPLEDIHEVIKPILAEHGFAIRHRTEWPADKANIIRIVGILSHEQGHREESSFEAPMDKSEYRTDIQSQGSTVSYGRRYTTLDLLNIATRKADNDGQGSQARSDVKAPEGFDAWWAVFEPMADQGMPALMEAWNKSKDEYRKHVMATNRGGWAALKTRAGQVGA